MNTLNKTLLVLFVIFTGTLASADQCAWNNKSVASRVRAFLAYYPGSIYTYCETCGDAEMKSVYIGYDYEKTEDGRAIHFREQEKQTEAGDVVWMFSVNEAYAETGIQRDLDLAYTFIKTENGYLNLGARFSCLDNKFWNPNKDEDFSGLPEGVSPWIPLDQTPVVEDVTESDYMDAHQEVYPDKPQG